MGDLARLILALCGLASALVVALLLVIAIRVDALARRCARRDREAEEARRREAASDAAAHRARGARRALHTLAWTPPRAAGAGDEDDVLPRR